MVKRLVLDQILKLDPQIDHARIVHLDSCYEFPFDFTRADEFALYRTYAVPSIANLLDSTGEFTERTQRRYDDTKLIISELVENGYDSERGQRTMRPDEHGAYRGLDQEFAGHEAVAHSRGEYVRGDAHTNTLEGAFSLFKGQIVGAHYHVSPEHLDRYWDEFEWKYNRRHPTEGRRFAP